MKTSMIAITSLLVGTAAVAQSEGMANYCQSAFIPTNGDATLTADEMEELRNAEYEMLDANKDGSISREEYVSCTSQQNEAAFQSAAATKDLRTDEVFDQVDANGDDQIDVPEYLNASVEAREQLGVDPTNWNEPFIFLGEGEDGTTASELSEEEYAARSGMMYRGMDADLDGLLSREEWISQADQLEVDISQVNARFDAADQDQSGEMNQQEFAAMSEMLSSEETRERLGLAPLDQ